MNDQPDQPPSPSTPTEDHGPANGPPLDLSAVMRLIDDLQRQLDQLRQVVQGQSSAWPAARFQSKAATVGPMTDREGLRIIEGVFDGQNMVGPDSKQYSVPANYASKSKLVEGDVLKLTITRDGSFIYKQIGPVERQRLIGTLVRDETSGDYRVSVNGRTYKVLLASVTYFKGDVGDEVVVLVPQDGDSRWAAVENIIKAGSAAPATAETV